MKINLTKAQYKDLLALVMLGSNIKESVVELRGENWQKVRDIEKFLLSHAYDFGADDIVEKYRGEIEPTNDFCLEIEDMEEEHREDEFWFTLSNRLGQRDFDESLTDEERKKIDADNGWLPNTVDAFYEKYEDEFDKHGVDRLRVDEKSPYYDVKK